MRNTTEVASGKLIAVRWRSVSYTAVAFYDIHRRKGVVLFFCCVSDITRDLTKSFEIINYLLIIMYQWLKSIAQARNVFYWTRRLVNCIRLNYSLYNTSFMKFNINCTLYNWIYLKCNNEVLLMYVKCLYSIRNKVECRLLLSHDNAVMSIKRLINLFNINVNIIFTNKSITYCSRIFN
jgi:hypothetical protein